MDIKSIKKSLLQDSVRLTTHAFIQMEKRGYTKSDVISGIMSGRNSTVKMYKGKLCTLVEGFDTDGLPIVVVLGRDLTKRVKFVVVTVMPPIDKKFSRVI